MARFKENLVTVRNNDGTTETVLGVEMNGGVMVPLIGIDDEIASIYATPASGGTDGQVSS